MVHTKNIPVKPQTRFNRLIAAVKGSTKAAAERLGISRRQVQRYRSGEAKIENAKKETQERLEKEVLKDHQPRVRAEALKRMQDKGLTVEARASFGFSSAAGSTDDPRLRLLTQEMPDHLLPDMFDALRDGDRERLSELVAEGLGEAYFRQFDARAQGLEVEFTDIDYIDLYHSR
ncbi:telomere-protecting terminal protein Tpg [Streptomyces coryli]